MKGAFLYGTAWKREKTAECVLKALHHGFRAIDTACQPKHYREDLVGQGIRRAFADGTLSDRDQIWIQTKFTRPEAQDPDACPYDMTATLEEQVHVSIQTSLRHLSHHRVDDPINDDSIYLDALLLHSPFPIEKFEDTLTVWRTMSLYVPHKIRALGVANISPEHLVRLYDAVDVKPSYVQNRFHEQTKWEITQRKFCKDHGIIFQAHKVLKSKDDILASSLIGEVSAVLGVTGEVALYLLVLGLGDYMTILNGTRNEIHMQEDLESLRRFETWATKPENQLQWQSHMACFKEFLHED